MQWHQLKRPRFFSGQVLTDQDLRDQQEYFLARLRLHNRFLHGWGVVAGLTVKLDGGDTVVVQPGLAIDCAGNELVLEAEARLPIAGDYGRQCVALGYVEVETDLAPSTEGGVECSRIKESVSVELLSQNPGANHQGMGPGTPGCGQSHPLCLATLGRRGQRWRVVSRLGRPGSRR